MSDATDGRGLFKHLQKQGVALPDDVIKIELVTAADEINLIIFTCHANSEVLKAMYLYACECAKGD